MDLEAAVRFVRARGDEAARLGLAVLLGEDAAVAATTAAVGAGQRADGGWAPFWMAESGLDATCFRVAQLAARGRVSSPMIRASAFLASRQRPDGTWQEEPRHAACAPPWCRPGEAAADLYATANCAYWLCRLAPDGEGAARGGAALRARIGRGGDLGSFARSDGLAAGALHALGRPEAAVLLAALAGRLASLSGGDLAWLVTALSDVGVPASDTVVAAARARLARAQEADGRWASDDGPSGDVHATLEALRALRT